MINSSGLSVSWGADMVNVESGAVENIAVVPNPGGHCGVGRLDLVIGSLEGHRSKGHRGNRLKDHVLRVGIGSPDGFLGLHIHIGLLVLPVVEGHRAVAGVVRLELEVLRLPGPGCARGCPPGHRPEWSCGHWPPAAGAGFSNSQGIPCCCLPFSVAVPRCPTGAAAAAAPPVPPQRLAPGREERRQHLGILPSLLAGLNLPRPNPISRSAVIRPATGSWSSL